MSFSRYGINIESEWLTVKADLIAGLDDTFFKWLWDPDVKWNEGVIRVE